jgi:hypothetical protein
MCSPLVCISLPFDQTKTGRPASTLHFFADSARHHAKKSAR